MAMEPLTPLQRDLLDILRDLARRGSECPSDMALARRMGADCKTADVMILLQRKGYIEIDRYGYKRVIRLADTGETTALPSENPIPQAQFRFGGDPCWSCGARPDAAPEFKCRRCR